MALSLGMAAAMAGGCSDEKMTSSAPPVSATPLDANAFSQLWRGSIAVPAGDHVTRVIMLGDTVYVYTAGGTVYGLDHDTGVVRFVDVVNSKGHELRPAVALNDDNIAYPTADTLELYSKRSGEFIKSIYVQGRISSDASSDGDVVYLGLDVGGGHLAQIDTDRPYHEVVWQLLLFGQVLGAPAAAQNVVFVGSGDGGVRAITNDEHSYWFLDHDRFNTGGAIVADIVLDGGNVYAASTIGRLVCLDRRNGLLRWQYYSNIPLTETPVVTKTMIYEHIDGLGIVALDKVQQLQLNPGDKHMIDMKSHTPIWQANGAKAFVSETDSYAFLIDGDGSILAVDKTTGARVYRAPNTGFAAFATDTRESTIFAAGNDGSVYAFKPTLAPGTPGMMAQ